MIIPKDPAAMRAHDDAILFASLAAAEQDPREKLRLRIMVHEANINALRVYLPGMRGEVQTRAKETIKNLGQQITDIGRLLK